MIIVPIIPPSTLERLREDNREDNKEKIDITTKNVYNINNNNQKEKLLCQIKNKHKK